MAHLYCIVYCRQNGMYTALLLEGLRRQFVFVLCAGLELVGSRTFRPVHVLNIDIKDNHEEATLGAFLVLKLCNMVRNLNRLCTQKEETNPRCYTKLSTPRVITPVFPLPWCSYNYTVDIIIHILTSPPFL